MTTKLDPDWLQSGQFAEFELEIPQLDQRKPVRVQF